MHDGPRFPDTRWSVVMLAARDGVAEAQSALGSLFAQYWYPLFAHLRSRGHARDEAEELLQAFFVHLCERQAIGRADPLKGSFRGFLLGCLKFFLANQRELAAAHKRGGHLRFVSLDLEQAEARLSSDVDPASDAERAFDRRWALLVMERALAQLQSDYVDRPETFAALKGFLTAQDETRYAEVARQLGVTQAVVKTTVHRMRARMREFLRSEIAATVSAPHEIDEELRHLVRVLAGD